MTAASPPKIPNASNTMTRQPAWTAQFLRHDTPACLTVSQMVTVNLRLKNIGSAVWPHRGNSAVQVAYRWIGADGKQRLDVEDRRTSLPYPVAINQEIALGVTLVAPRTPGIYRLRWDLLLGSDNWFSDRGKSALVVPVTVTVLPSDVNGWRVESNVNSGDVGHALDGDPRTYWDSQTLQVPDQWYRLTLPSLRRLDGIQFLSPGKGFPSGYSLYVSADGKDWIEVKRIESGNKYDVMAILAPQWVEHVQLHLLGASSSNWMISEILIHPAAEWKVKASHNSDAATLAIDNRNDTAWSSQEPQAAGMWFQIDLGREETVNGIKLIAPAEENPISYRITTWNASARRWQLGHEETNGSAAIEAAFAPTQTQFVNIQLLEASENLWTIQSIQIYREMESWLGPSA